MDEPYLRLLLWAIAAVLLGYLLTGEDQKKFNGEKAYCKMSIHWLGPFLKGGTRLLE